MNAHLSPLFRSLLRFVELRSVARRSLALGHLPLARQRTLEPRPGGPADDPAVPAAAGDDKPRGCCHV